MLGWFGLVLSEGSQLGLGPTRPSSQVVGLPAPDGPKMGCKTAKMVSKTATMVPGEPNVVLRFGSG
eukprot:8860852-Pyramimonas_sp.AAC.1